MILHYLRVTIICQYLLLDHAQSEDIFLDCPDRWTESQEVILHCTIARSKFPSQCSDKEHEMYFTVSKNSRTLETNCIVSSFNCPSTKLTSGCYCAAANSTVYTFIYKFPASAEYKGTWGCDVYCVNDDGNSVLTTGSSKSCNNVTVGPVGPVASGYFITGQSTAIFVSMIFTVVYMWS